MTITQPQPSNKKHMGSALSGSVQMPYMQQCLTCLSVPLREHNKFESVVLQNVLKELRGNVAK